MVLLDCIVLKDCEGKGFHCQGLFTTADIPKGTLLWYVVGEKEAGKGYTRGTHSFCSFLRSLLFRFANTFMRT